MHKTTQDTINQNLLTQMATPPQQPNITVSQPPININTNPLQPQPQPQTIEKKKMHPIKKSALRIIKSKTKAGTLFKPPELEGDAISVISMSSSLGGPPGVYQEQEEDPILTRAMASSERLAKFHTRQSREEKKNRK